MPPTLPAPSRRSVGLSDSPPTQASLPSPLWCRGKGILAGGASAAVDAPPAVLPQVAPRFPCLERLAPQRGALPDGGGAPPGVPGAEGGAPQVRLVVEDPQPAPVGSGGGGSEQA